MTKNHNKKHTKSQDENNAQCIVKSTFLTTNNLCLSYLHCDKRSKTKCGCYEDDCRPVVILIHDVGYDSKYWLCLIEKLCGVANVFAIDLPNAGDSETTSVSLSSQDFLTQYLLDFVNHISTDKVYLVGHGLGALVALNFSIDHADKVEKIVAASPNPRLFPVVGLDWPFTIPAQLLQLINQSLAPRADLDTISESIINLIDPTSCHANDFLIDHYSNNLDQYRIFLQVLQNTDFRIRASQVTVPVLLTAGTKDPLTPLGASLFLNDVIANSALVEFYNQGHNYPIFNASLFNQNVFNFFFVICDPCCIFLDTIEKKCKPCHQKKPCECEEENEEKEESDCECEEEEKSDSESECESDSESESECDSESGSDSDSDCESDTDEFKYKCKIVIPCRYTK